MPGKVERSILWAGGSKLAALPPDWLRYYGLDRGDSVEMIYDGLIIIKPVGLPLTPEDLEVEVERLKRLIVMRENRAEVEG